MSYLLLTHCNNGWTNTSQCYVIRAIPVLLLQTHPLMPNTQQQRLLSLGHSFLEDERCWMKSLPSLRHAISISSLYPPTHTGQQSGRSPGMVLTWGTKRERNRAAGNRPSLRAVRKQTLYWPAVSGATPQITSVWQHELSVQWRLLVWKEDDFSAGKEQDDTDFLHNFPQPFEKNAGTLLERFLPNSFSVHCLFISVLCYKSWQHCT